MKLLALVLIAEMLIVAINMSGQPTQTANAKQKPTQNKNQAASSANSPEHSSSTEQNERTSDKEPTKWYAALKRPEWLLVIAAFITLVIVAWQSYETRRAASATQKSAAAFINKERSRLFIHHAISEEFDAFNRERRRITWL